MGEIKTPERNEQDLYKPEGFRNIKPEHGTLVDRANSFMNGLFGEKIGDHRSDVKESELEKTVNEYWDEMKSYSEYPVTFSEKSFDSTSLERRSPEETAILREEFNAKKAQLKKEWAEKNGIPWPKYDHDVYSSSGRLIRKAGSDYDAHHEKPLCLGGENTAENITPLHADVHYDSQGVHAPGSAYDRLSKMNNGGIVR